MSEWFKEHAWKAADVRHYVALAVVSAPVAFRLLCNFTRAQRPRTTTVVVSDPGPRIRRSSATRLNDLRALR
jgi:hypothetical protein